MDTGSDGALVQPPGDRGPASRRELIAVALIFLAIFMLCTSVVMVYL